MSPSDRNLWSGGLRASASPQKTSPRPSGAATSTSPNTLSAHPQPWPAAKRLSTLLRGWWPTALVTALILYAVLTPNPPTPDDLPLFPGADKIVHAGMMATLTIAALNDRRRTARRLTTPAILIITLAVLAFGPITELLQSALTTTRSCDPADMLADWAGTLLIALPALLLRKKLLKHR